MDDNVIETTVNILLNHPIWLAGGVIALCTLIFIFIRTRRMPYYARETLLTSSELKFYQTLRHAIDSNALIMMKVRMADIIHCKDKDWDRGWGHKISSKHIDFVVIDKETSAIQFCIELDDSTHRTVKERIDRDTFVNKAFATADVKLIRVPVSKFYNVDSLKKSIMV